MAGAADTADKIYRGIAVSPGICRAEILVLDRGHEEAPHRRPVPPARIPVEIERLEQALTDTRQQIREVQQKVRNRIGSGNAAIFDAHLLVLEDPVLIEEVTRTIREERVNAEWAFHQTLERYTEALSEVADDYLAERAADLRDVGSRVHHTLTGQPAHVDLRNLEEPCIIVAHDLTPTMTAQLDRDRVLGFATDVGGKTSHTAIMAGSLGIPAVVGLQNATQELTTGDFALLDGINGLIIIHPSEQTLYEYGQLERRQEGLAEQMLELRDSPAVTLDGMRITLSANVEQISDTAAVLDSGAEGVGLFRTEYLFLDRETLPTEVEQFESYHRIAKAMQPHNVIFRTLDIGGDKLSAAVGGAPEANPFLGWRAIRFCLARDDIFRTQLRAILRASAAGNVKLMYPMISGVEEIDEANKLLEECKADLRAQEEPFDETIDIGVMIEIPSAVMIADALARRAKFFSLGTNDLIQYSLAVDRLNERVADLYDPSHPALLKLIQLTVAAGKRQGIWTGVCGEMASDPALTPLLLGLGVNELSVAPPLLPPVKYLIRHLKLSEAKELAADALESESSMAVLARSRAMAQRAAPAIFGS